MPLWIVLNKSYFILMSLPKIWQTKPTLADSVGWKLVISNVFCLNFLSDDSCEDEEELVKPREPSKYSYVNQFPVDVQKLEAAHAQAAKASRQRPNTPPPQVWVITFNK